MTTTTRAGGRRTTERRRYQDEVEALLGEIGRRADELRRFRAGGAQAAALRERKQDLSRVRARLAELIRVGHEAQPRWQLAPSR